MYINLKDKVYTPNTQKELHKLIEKSQNFVLTVLVICNQYP